MRRDLRRTIVAAAAMLSLLGAAPGQAQPAPGSGYAQIGALRLYYEVHGKGKPLLILHGGGSTIETSFGAMRSLLGFEGWSDAQLASIKAPTMIVQANDDVAPLEHIAQMARIIPGAQLVVLPGSHMEFLDTRGQPPG